MKHTNNTELHILQKATDASKRVPRNRTATVECGQDDPMDELEEKIKKHKKRFWKRTIVSTIVVAMVIIGTYLLVELQRYDEVRVLSRYKEEGTANSNYAGFVGGILKYSHDGVSLKDYKGKEVWNQPCQIKNPIVDVHKGAAVLVDKGGNDMLVFEAKGLKGEIRTTLPIEKAVVSGQGIVSAILKDEATPRVVCYDAAGNLLVEQKASISGTGYPIDLAISENGYLLMVSYLRIQNGVMTTKVAYYNFDNGTKGETKHQVLGEDYENEIMPSVFFMDNQTAVVAGERSILIYKGKSELKMDLKIDLNKEIKSVFHTEKNIGLILKNQGKAGYEIRLYNKNGREVLSKEFIGEYGHVKMSGNRVIMYEGRKCSVYKKSGVLEFEGELNVEALDIVPITGINKYIVMSTGGMEQIRFVK